MSKFFVLFFFLVAFVASAAQACQPRHDTRYINGQPHRVQIANPDCVKTVGRSGDGVYNGRRKAGIVIGAIIGGGLAHALGGDAGQVVTGVLGGAQTGTYIGSTFDGDAQLRDQIRLNRSRCGAGTYYNTVSHQCEVESGGVPQSPAQSQTQAAQAPSGQISFRTVAEADAYCANLEPGGFFHLESGKCLRPETRPAPVSLGTDADALCKLRFGARIAEAQRECVAIGRRMGLIVKGDGSSDCGCPPNSV